MQNLSKKCSDVRSNLPLFVGRDLESLEMEVVKAHLAECEACRFEHEAAQAARTAFLTLHGAELDDEPTFEWSGTQPVSDLKLDLWPGIEAQLAAEGLLADSGELSRPAAAVTGFRLLVGGKLAWGGAAAAALVLAWFGFLAGPGAEPAPEPVAHVEEPTVVAPEPILSIQGVDLAVKTTTGGLRPIDRSEGLAQDARIFHVDMSIPVTPGSANRNNPNAAAGFRRGRDL